MCLLLLIREACQNKTNRSNDATENLQVSRGFSRGFGWFPSGFRGYPKGLRDLNEVSGSLQCFRGFPRGWLWFEMMMDGLTKHNPEMLSHLKIRVISPWFYTQAYFLVTTPTDDYFQITIENFDKWSLSDWLTKPNTEMLSHLKT